MTNQIDSLKTTQGDAAISAARPDLSSFAAFKDSFPLQGAELYATVFERNADLVQTQKEKFAVANLEKILTATFAISSSSGFERMSIRDLSRSTGMSMGAIYSCITKKEDIALMVADIVRLSNDMTRQHGLRATSIWAQIVDGIRFHLYASSLLQAWYFFLFFETRSLPERQQAESMQIELDAIQSFQQHIETGVEQGEFVCKDPHMVANIIVVMLEDWYLKPWKNYSIDRQNAKQSVEQRGEEIETYHQSLVTIIKHMLT